MIEKYYSNPNKPVFKYTPPTHDYFANIAKRLNITREECIRRDDIIRAKSALCQVHPAIHAWPKDKDLFDQFGECKIVDVIRTIANWPAADAWPDDDDPHIVTARCVQDNAAMTANAMTFVKVKPTFEEAV